MPVLPPSQTHLRPGSLRKALHGLFAAGLTVSAAAQAPSPQTPTLHVYANLLQIPALITDRFGDPAERLNPARFRVVIQDGPVITPRRVRLEGDDPITLAVLIDNSSRLPLIDALPDAVAAIAKKGLHPTDRVAIYASDGCHLRRFSLLEVPQESLLRQRVTTALADPPAHGGADCSGPRHLWDAMAWALGTLAGQPGRRVLLAITPGEDTGSVFSADQLAARATDTGVAIFAITPASLDSPGSPFHDVPGARLPASYLQNVTDSSGGIILSSSARGMASTLQRLLQLLRGRYIVEFTRPANMPAGRHSFQLDLGGGDYVIRAAGTSLPVADPVAPATGIEHSIQQHDETPATAPAP